MPFPPLDASRIPPPGSQPPGELVRLDDHPRRRRLAARMAREALARVGLGLAYVGALAAAHAPALWDAEKEAFWRWREIYDRLEIETNPVTRHVLTVQGEAAMLVFERAQDRVAHAEYRARLRIFHR